MSRPLVGIERLPTRRVSNEPRESMNCKSCRKRKIKCNRLRPSCEACQVFQCPCIYDAVPKKRGPKTDVLEALLKRVDGLEQKLKESKPDASADGAPDVKADPGSHAADVSTSTATSSMSMVAAESQTDTKQEAGDRLESPTSEPPMQIPTEALIDVYFSRCHARPFHILDESSVRQRFHMGRLPSSLLHAILAVASRYNTHPRGHHAAVRQGEEFALQARKEVDLDEPSVDALQTLLLLVLAFTAAGRGKKAYMSMTNAIGMVTALELHREMDVHAQTTQVERETRRRLFWTCYLLDRFMACGSKRPSLIGDRTILLRLPSWTQHPAAIPVEGDFFLSATNPQYYQGGGHRPRGSAGMLIDITRILGNTSQYLAAGGAKGDSHFPWHPLSTLSKIRTELQDWAEGSKHIFSSVDMLFGQADSTTLVLGKLVYHLIHCLIYRPFLPIDLSELSGTGQHQSWQLEASRMCFAHANAIAELVEIGRQMGTVEWPAFVGYCICTAGTVHVHGAHYSRRRDGNGGGSIDQVYDEADDFYAASANFLAKEMQQLDELARAWWASVQVQRDTLQRVYTAHSALTGSLAGNPMRYSAVFQLEDFFDRYCDMGGQGGESFRFDDVASFSLSDVTVPGAGDLYGVQGGAAAGGVGSASDAALPPSAMDHRPSLKRKNTGPLRGKRPELPIGPSTFATVKQPPTSSLSAPPPGQAGSSSGHRHLSFSASSTTATATSNQASTPSIVSMAPATASFGHADVTMTHAQLGTLHEQYGEASGDAVAAGYPISPTQTSHQPHAAAAQQRQQQQQQQQQQQAMATGLSQFAPPAFGFGAGPAAGGPVGGDEASPAVVYDAVFGTLPPNAFSSPVGGAWHQQQQQGHQQQQQSHARQHQPGSPGSGAGGEEKDPFLSLLEQLVESGQLPIAGQGGDLDFMFAAPGPDGGPGAGSGGVPGGGGGGGGAGGGGSA